MRRILSIICIIFLIGITSVVPIYSTSYFVYAEESNPLLPVEEVIDAGMSVYLNSRNGFLVAANGGLDAVKSVMKAYKNAYYLIDNNHFTDDTLAGYMLVQYNPFRVRLKGTAVKFFNDLVDWLIDQGKLNNANSSNGGNTTDNWYQGYSMGSNLFYIYNSRQHSLPMASSDLIATGSVVDHCTGDYIYSLWRNNNPDYNLNSQVAQVNNSTYVNIQYSQNIKVENDRIGIKLSFSDAYYNSCSPALSLIGGSFYGGMMYAERDHKVRGNAAWFIDNADPRYFYYGVASYDITADKYFFNAYGSYTRNDIPDTINDASVSFDTDNFVKTPTTEPSGDEEIEYIPKDKTTNNTYNTYNEYINNYITKNTYITNNTVEPEPDPGGTVPDWSGGGGSGTITPDGNGGYTFELPDFSLPDLDIDWNINGLSQKFPFSIPFDLLAFFTVLNAEPETPAIEATIPLGLWEWDIDWDLHNFDTLAALLRNLEFIGFCIGLALITRNIIKG